MVARKVRGATSADVPDKEAVLSQRFEFPRDENIYGCPEKFRESLATPTATFPEIVNEILL